MEDALFKCFHIKFQQHKEIMEGDSYSLELDKRNKVGTVFLASLCFLGGSRGPKETDLL